MWEVEVTDDWREWFFSLDEGEQDAIAGSVGMLQAVGPSLGRPHADTVKGSRHANLKELRTQHAGQPYRSFYAFDPRRTAILLIGGCKAGDDRFYERMIPQADRLYDDYLDELKSEGLL